MGAHRAAQSRPKVYKLLPGLGEDFKVVCEVLLCWPTLCRPLLLRRQAFQQADRTVAVRYIFNQLSFLDFIAVQGS